MTLFTTGTGGFVAPALGSSAPPATIYLQVIDPNPTTFEFSNAVELVIGS
jgi:hypothetical protein